MHRWFVLKILAITIIILVLSHAIVYTISRISILDSLSKSVTDFDFTDLYYSNVAEVKGWNGHDSTIIIVNIGYLDRKGIAALIDTLRKHQPRTVGLDAFFSSERDPEGDSSLATAIARTKNCVLVSQLLSASNFPPFDSVTTSIPSFVANASTGYANINIPEDDKTYGTVRGFISSYDLEGMTHRPFGLELAWRYDSTLLQRYPDEKGRLVLINFFGYASKPWLTGEEARLGTFTALSYHEVLEERFEGSLLRDKIVLLGYMGDQHNPDHTERFYTPLNERYAGRSLPDMFGVEVHANIIKMLLERRYIASSPLVDAALSYIIVFLAVWACERIHALNPRQFQLISTALIFVLINAAIFLPLLFFIATEVKIDLRSCVFYLIFVPTFYEVIDINVFQRWEQFRMKQT